MLVVAVISVNAYPFYVSVNANAYLEDTGIGAFWFHCDV